MNLFDLTSRATAPFSFRRSLAACAIFRNEAPYLNEWLTFHQKQGVEKFYLINHKSADNFLEVLRPWIQSRMVTLIEATTDDQQAEYNLVLEKYGRRTRWLAFIDIDEFLFSPTNQSIPRVLEKLPSAAAVFVYWRLFGSSNKLEPSGEEGVLRTYQTCLTPPTDLAELLIQRATHREIRANSKMTGAPVQGKCIVRTSKVKKMAVHWPEIFRGKVTDEMGNLSNEPFTRLDPKAVPTSEILRINHYWSRSITELRVKSLREPVHRGLRNNKNLKELPGSRSEHWDAHLNHSLDTAALENFQEELPFVFLIGFNKTATRSFHDFFVKNGFPAVHWDRNRLVERMLDNQQKGLRLLTGYENFRVFSDFTLITDEEYFEGNSMFRQLYRDYPSGYFILNNRPTEDWIKSRLSQNNGKFASRHLKIRGLNSMGELSSAWEEEKETHEQAVRSFFTNKKRFGEIFINSPEVPNQLANLLGRDFHYSLWPTVRRLREPVTDAP
jgi:hypothetical protein